MAKGQMRSNKEKKKPKAEWNQKKKGGQAPASRFGGPAPLSGMQSQGGQNPLGKKA